MGHFFEQGFSVREPMWHGLGTILGDYPGRADAMEAAGHDFEIFETPISPQPIVLPTGVTVAPYDHEGWKALVRGDSGTTLSCVRKTYTVIQPETLWDIADAIVSSTNVRYETAGILKNGEILWVLARLDEPVFIGPDPSPTFPYVLVSSYNDGRGSCTARTVTVRVVCWNTQTAAESESDKSGRVFTFAHRGDVNTRIEEAKEVLMGVRADHAAQIAEAKELLAIRITERRREDFLTKFIPLPVGETVSDRVVANVEGARGMIRNILNSKTSEGIADTGYGLQQAAVEYLDHYRKAFNSETLFRRSFLEPKPFKVRAARMIRELADA